MATIGIDLTPIQGPHRMRGVGSTVINVLTHVANEDKQSNVFVFYTYQTGRQEALDLINAQSFPNHEVCTVADAQPVPPSIKSIAGLLQTPRRMRNAILDRKFGGRRITHVNELDVFLQFEQDVLPPVGVKSIIIAYDLIPYILESDYLWNYSTARKLHNYSWLGALRMQVKRNLYIRNIRAVMNRAHRVIAISNHTKSDFVKFAKTPANKIEVCYLGVSDNKITQEVKPQKVDRYINTSWGDIKVQASLPGTPFLLFVGGVDPRRKLADLVHAFNQLRAQGHDIHLVLAGDTMLGPMSVPNSDIRRALMSSSYLDDIYMLGFINLPTREWLYQNALTFVYPSRYEGFGLPILEAMRFGTNVIAYDTSSVREIAKNNIRYASSPLTIAKNVIELLNQAKPNQHQYANQYKWSQTANSILNLVKGVTSYGQNNTQR